MNDVDRLILEAWRKLGPKIMSDPDELAKRLARRRMAILTRPVRGWCIAVRACDTRITPAHWVISPEHAMDLNHPAHPYQPIEHEVTIRPHALRKYCRPVRTDSWGELVQDVASQLGCTPSALLRARWAGLFTERFVKGLGGKRGFPIPLIHSWNTLDPSGGCHFQRPEQLWGSLWEFLPDMLPDDFEQTVIRLPKFNWMCPKDYPGREFGEGRQFLGWRWLCPACKKQVRTIYCPLPPNTLFDFLGYDPANYITYHGRPRRSSSSLDVERSMLNVRCSSNNCLNPQLQTQNPSDFHFKTPPKKFVPSDLHRLEPPPPTFACGDCHKVQGTTRTTSQCWNLIVTTLTRGLLFGHEVPKPTWYEPRRKIARSRRLGRQPLRRQAVLRRLLNGWPDRRIARDVMMTLAEVQKIIRLFCKQERVANRAELAIKLGSPHPQPLNQIQNARHRRRNVEKLLLQGLTNNQICAAEGLALNEVKDELHRIYRQHNLPKSAGRKALAQKLGIQLAGNYAINHQIRTRILDGQTYRQIATEMGLTYCAVNRRATRICHNEGVRGKRELMQKMPQSALDFPTFGRR